MFARTAVVILVMMNLAAAGWLWQRGPVSPPPPAPFQGPGLVLLSEAETLPQPPDSAESDAPPEPLAQASQCLSLGPFLAPADVRRAEAVLQPVVSRSRSRETREMQVQDYKVFLPAASSREQALATVRELAGKGMQDYFVVTSGEAENTISLGRFGSLANAQERVREVRALGLEGQLESRTREVSAWWLDFAADPDFDWHAHLPEPWPQQAQPIDCF